MIEGAFLESGTDPHIPLREEVLGSGPVLPAPAAPVIPARSAGFPGDGGAEMLAELERRGLAVVQLDRPLSNEAFLALGALLGVPMAEMDPAVQPQVEHGTILNLVTKYGHTRDVSMQPFATQRLTLHTESSAKSAATQPRYIVLMCFEPGDNSTAAQTVLVPMDRVLHRIPPRELELLAGTRYKDSAEAPFIVRDVDGRRVLSYRDFNEQPLRWTHASATATEEEVNGALRRLLAALYAPDSAMGIHWKPGMLVVIDNTFWFHGRTAGAVTFGSQPRHLKRLRILAAQ